MKKITQPLVLALGVLSLSGGAALAAGDVANGEKQFKRCASCHRIETPEGERIGKAKGKTGPNLYGVIGRTAGTQEDFKRYKKSIVAAGEKGLVWDEETIAAYVVDPKGFLTEFLGEKAQSGMPKQKVNGADIAAYLASVGPAPAEAAPES